MKKIMTCLITMICLLGLAAGTSANTGRAIIPPTGFSYFTSSSYVQPQLFISNITNNSISITITFYDKNGAILTGVVSGLNLNNLNSSPGNASISFDLAANATGYVFLNLNSASTNFGYGIIGWTQNSTAVYGLVANGSNVWYNNGRWINSYSIPINNGLPF